MLGRNPSEPALFQMVDVESLVPANHQLRKIDAVLDLSFVPEVVAECYSANRGRPSIDPELAVRMMVLGVLYDLSDRELCDEIQMDAGMRWFCGLKFHDPVPDHSTLSRLRGERWSESGPFERLMDEVIRQCSEAGFVSGRHLSVDGTEVRADANVKSLMRRGPRGPDDQDPPQGSKQGTGEPKPAGGWKGHGQRYANETHFSPTDPDARLYRKGNQRGARLSYLVHDLIDTKFPRLGLLHPPNAGSLALQIEGPALPLRHVFWGLIRKQQNVRFDPAKPSGDAPTEGPPQQAPGRFL